MVNCNGCAERLSLKKELESHEFSANQFVHYGCAISRKVHFGAEILHSHVPHKYLK